MSRDILDRLTHGHKDLRGDDYWSAVYRDIADARAEIERLRAAHEQVARDCFKIANDDTIPESVRQSCLTIGRLAVKAYNGEQAEASK